MSDETEDAAPKKRPGVITTEQACTLLMITPQWLQALTRQGHLHKVVRGQYVLVQLVQDYIKYLREQNKDSTKTATDSRVRSLREQEIEMKLEERSKSLVAEALQEAVSLFDDAAGGLKADLLSIPARVTKDIPLRRKIENEINDALGAAAKRARAAASTHGPGGGALGQPAAPAARRVGAAKPRLSAKQRRTRKA